MVFHPVDVYPLEGGGLGDGDNLQDTEKTDGRSFTGIDVYGTDTENDGWVQLGTLTRVNVDLGKWTGNPVIIRFRVITNTEPGYLHRHVDGEYYGIYIDDVIVSGETIQG